MKRVCKSLITSGCMRHAEKKCLARSDARIRSFIQKVTKMAPPRLTSAVWRAMRNWSCCVSRHRMYIVHREDMDNRMSPFHLVQRYVSKDDDIPRDVVDQIYLCVLAIMCSRGHLSRFMLMHIYSCMYTVHTTNASRCVEIYSDARDTVATMIPSAKRTRIQKVLRFCFAYTHRHGSSGQ